jgi:hypothetical protein
MFHTTSFWDLRNPEFIQQGKDLIKVIGDTDPKKLAIEKQYLLFDADVKAIDAIYKPSLANSITKILLEQDAKRDTIFMGICFIVDGYKKSWLPDMMAQANLINDSINIFGRMVIDANYQSESASLTSLIDKWESNPKLLAALTAMHLLEWKDELKVTNNLFIKNHTDRSKEEGVAATLPKIKALKRKAIQSWQKFEKVLMGKIVEFEDDAVKTALYNTLTNNINGVLDNYTNLLALRKSKKGDDPIEPAI